MSLSAAATTEDEVLALTAELDEISKELCVLELAIKYPLKDTNVIFTMVKSHHNKTFVGTGHVASEYEAMEAFQCTVLLKERAIITLSRSIKMNNKLKSIALVALAFLVLDNLRDIFQMIPVLSDVYAALREVQPTQYFTADIFSVLQVVFAVAIVMGIKKTFDYKAGLSELGLSSSIPEGLVFGLLAVLPLWVVFAFAFPLQTGISWDAVFFLALLSPIAEEVVFRGFAFRQLRDRLGFGFWTSSLSVAVVFGLVHLGMNQDLMDSVMVFLITALGSVVFSWTFEKSNFNLWYPIALHSLMNLSRNIFEVGVDSAYAGFLPTVMQLVTVVTVVVIIKMRGAK